MEKTMMSKRDVIVCRGIWYVMALLSLFGLSVSLNLLWPPGGKSSSRFLRDGAVSATTFYAVTLLRYLFFTDPPSTNNNWYKEFTTVKERIPQLVFAELCMGVLLSWPPTYSRLVDRLVSFVCYMSLFTISLFTGGVGLIQLSDKFRMELRHACFTIFSGWLCCLVGIYIGIGQNLAVLAFLIVVYWLLFLWIFGYNLYRDKGMDTFSVSPLPT